MSHFSVLWVCYYLCLLSNLGLLFTSLSQWCAANIGHPWGWYQSSDQLQCTQPTRSQEVYRWLTGVHCWGAGNGEIQNWVWARVDYFHNFIIKSSPVNKTNKIFELSFLLLLLYSSYILLSVCNCNGFRSKTCPAGQSLFWSFLFLLLE